MFWERSRWAFWAGALGVLILVGALYAQTLDFKFIWDDDQIIYGRIDYQSPSRWLEAVCQPLDFSPNYFRPLALSSLLVQIWLWKDNPAPFHAVNVLIHLLNTALVIALGMRLLSNRGLALLGGALYGVHPALIESVAFVSSRYDLMATLFLLLALWLEGRLAGRARVIGVSLVFLGALLCKEMALMFPLVLLLWQLAQGGDGSIKAQLARLIRTERALYGALGLTLVVYFGIRYAALGYLFTAPIGEAQIEAGTPLQHLLLMGRTLTTLATLASVPFFSITPAHHSELPVPVSDGWAWAQLGIAVLILLGMAYLVRRRPHAGWLFAAGLISLLPVLNIRPLEFAYGVFTAERFLTFPLALALMGILRLPSPPTFLLRREQVRLGSRSNSTSAPSPLSVDGEGEPRAGGAALPPSPLTERGARFKKSGARASWLNLSVASLSEGSWGVRALLLFWGVALLITTAYNLPNWRDPERFWLWLTNASPRSPIGFSNLSDLYNKMGRHSEALEYAEKAIQTAPRSGMGYVNKGVALLRLGNPDEAIALFRKATEIEPSNVTGWNNLAVMLSERGEHDEAERIIQQHVLGKPPQFMGHQALGLIYTRRTRLDLAEAEFRKAYALMPNPAGSIADDGLKQLQTASRWIAAAHYWMNQRQLELAERHLQAAAQRDPDKIAYGIAMGRLRILQNRPAEARQFLREVQSRGYSDATVVGLLNEAAQMLRHGEKAR